jgi:hypothetical protein
MKILPLIRTATAAQARPGKSAQPRPTARQSNLHRRFGNQGLARLLLQRDARKGAPKKAAPVMPTLGVHPAKNAPPCACIVFIHHNEPNARLTARLMHELCRYNLAIVQPETTARKIDLPGKGAIDPNELFPRHVAEQCWSDDKPCEDFLKKNAGATDAAVVEEMAQRQFFLAVKSCSEGFSLPVIGLHNNTIDETERYRKAVKDPKTPLDLSPIRGKTFDDTLKAGEKAAEADTLPFADLQEWLQKNVPGVGKKAKPKGPKDTLEGGPLTPRTTNIFHWCSAADISRCHIGDPARPDSIVWVTNSADFEKLRGTKTNVVLQTRVDPGGESATDLSSLFVFLAEIMEAHFFAAIATLEAEVNAEAARQFRASWNAIWRSSTEEDLADKRTQDQRDLDLRNKQDKVKLEQAARVLALAKLRFINIETPQKPTDPAMKPEDLRVQSYRDIRATLMALGLDCCDDKPAEGEAEGAVQKVEKALRAGKLPEPEPPAKAAP